MADAATLRTQLAKLKSARASGAMQITFADRTVRYRSDREIATAISAIEAELAALEGSPRVRNLVLRSVPDRGW